MTDINQALLIGNVGKDPEVRTFQDGGEVASFPMATNKNWKDKSGEKQSKTVWHQVRLQGGAVKMAQYIHKGDKVLVQGEIVTRKANDIHYTDIVVGYGGTVRVILSKDRQDSNGAEPLTSTQQQLDDSIPF